MANPSLYLLATTLAGVSLALTGCSSTTLNQSGTSAYNQPEVAHLTQQLAQLTSTINMGKPLCNKMVDSPLSSTLLVQTIGFENEGNISEEDLNEKLSSQGFQRATWMELTPDMVHILDENFVYPTPDPETVSSTAHRTVWKKTGEPTLYVVWEEGTHFLPASGCSITPNRNPNTTHVTVVAATPHPNNKYSPLPEEIFATEGDESLTYGGEKMKPSDTTSLYLQKEGEALGVKANTHQEYSLYNVGFASLAHPSHEIAARTRTTMRGVDANGEPFRITQPGTVNTTVFPAPYSSIPTPIRMAIYPGGKLVPLRPNGRTPQSATAITGPATVTSMSFSMHRPSGKLVGRVTTETHITLTADMTPFTIVCPAPTIGKHVTFTQNECV